jgi:branched-chain amino acid transport system substrate-binding protein
VRIGAVYNLTGPLSALGLPSMAGARLAVQQLNQRGGVLGRAVELLASDGRTDPATVAAVTLQLVRTPNLSAITGLDDTAMALAAAPIAEKARMVFLTAGATSPKLPLDFPDYFFMACFGDNTQAAAGAEYAYQMLAAKKTWLLFDNTTDYTVLLASYFKTRYTELGGTIVGEDTYAGGTTDFSSQIARILVAAYSSRHALCIGGPDDIGRLVMQLRAAGIQQPIFGGDGYDTPSSSRPRVPRRTTHTSPRTRFMDPQQGTPIVKQFFADYQAAFGVRPDNAFAALGYDAIMLVANAIEGAGSAKQKEIPSALEATHDFAGVTGRISFAPGVHIPKKEVTILKIDGGKLTLAAVYYSRKNHPPRSRPGARLGQRGTHPDGLPDSRILLQQSGSLSTVLNLKNLAGPSVAGLSGLVAPVTTLHGPVGLSASSTTTLGSLHERLTVFVALKICRLGLGARIAGALTTAPHLSSICTW